MNKKRLYKYIFFSILISAIPFSFLFLIKSINQTVVELEKENESLKAEVKKLSEYKLNYNAEREKSLSSKLENLEAELDKKKKAHATCELTKDVYKKIFIAARANK